MSEPESIAVSEPPITALREPNLFPNMNQPQKQIAIIGGGLAGTFMAARLLDAGYQVVLFDQPQVHSASRVAAGLFNIITGRFGAKSWLGEQLLAEIESFLNQPAYVSLRPYVHYTEIYRPFKTVEDYNKWTGRRQDPSYAPLIRFAEESVQPDQLVNPLGGIFVLPCGWLETDRFVVAFQALLQTRAGFSLVQERIRNPQIDLQKRQIQGEQGTVGFDEIVFAQGPETLENPWFSPVKIIPNKGEILILEIPDLQLPFVFSRKVYLIPLGEDRYLCGSTYANQFDHPHPTEAGRAEIESQLQQALRLPYRTLDHRAGIRPTTPNRRPVLGTHPDMPFVHLLSGFGTKGVLLAPYTSRLLCEQIQGKSPEIPTEAALSRFYK